MASARSRRRCCSTPRLDPGSLRRALDDLGLSGRAIVFEGAAGVALAPPPSTGSRALQELVRSAWRLDDLALEYRDFLDRFGPLDDMPEGRLLHDPETCFGLRTLAIHEYRRILLRDPQLPEELLPEQWEGREARQLCARLYQRLEARAAQHLLATCQTSNGRLPTASRSYWRRFDGLGETSLRRAG